MRLVLYHRYMLTGMARPDRRGSWHPVVSVSRNGQEEFTLEHSAGFSGESEAENYAIGIGKHWVNNRLQTEMLAYMGAV
jgi:hypothetical protein